MNAAMRAGGLAPRVPLHTSAPRRAAPITRVALWMTPAGLRFDLLPAARPNFGPLVEGARPEAALPVAARLLGPWRVAQEAATRAALGLAQADGAALAIAREALSGQAARLRGLATLAGVAPDPAPTTDDPAAILHALFGRAGPPRRLRTFETWIAGGETALARAFAVIWSRCDARWGRADLPLWIPGRGVAGLDWRDARLCGAAIEAGVAARAADADLPREVEARRGRGLVWRLVCRIADAARLAASIEEGAGAPAFSPAPGVGAALTAQGPLLVRARLRPDGRVAEFEALDAACFALDPDGLLATGLSHLPRHDPAALRMATRLVADSVDVGSVAIEIAGPAAL